VGGYGVGKTSIVRKIVDPMRDYEENPEPTIEDVYTMEETVNGQETYIHIIDPGGHVRDRQCNIYFLLFSYALNFF